MSSTGPDSFTALYDAHHKYASHLARFAGVPAADAEDVVQEAFLALHVAMTNHRYDSFLPARSWLKATTFRIAVRFVAHLRKQGQPQAFGEDFPEPVDSKLTPEHRSDLAQQWELMYELLGSLPTDRRLVFVMHDLEDMTTAEISEVLAISPGTVSTRLRLARQDFEEAWTRKRSEERRAMHGLMVALLPLDATALVQHARSLPLPEAAPGARERVWRRLQRAIHAEAPVPSLLSPRNAGLLAAPLALAPANLVAGALMVVLVGAGAGGGVMAALKQPPRVGSSHRDVVQAATLDHVALPRVEPSGGADATMVSTAGSGVAAPQVERTATSSVPPVSPDVEERVLLRDARTALKARSRDLGALRRILAQRARVRSPDVQYVAEWSRILQTAAALEERAPREL